MGCITPREEQDFEIQRKEISLQIILCSIETIKNGFFYLNDGNSITEEYLLLGYQNISVLISGLIRNKEEKQELLKKFIKPFKNPDGTYQYQEIIICFYLNSLSKSVEKAKAIVQLLFKNKESLNLDEIKEIFQKIFKLVLNYSNTLMEKVEVPKQNIIQESKNEENKQKPDQEGKQDNKEEIKDQQSEEKKEGEKKEKTEEKSEEKKEQKNEEKKEEKKDEQKEKKDEKKLQIIKSIPLEEQLNIGKILADDIATKLLDKQQQINVNEFAEKCSSFIPQQYNRDIMWPRGVRLLVYQEFDKKNEKPQQQ